MRTPLKVTALAALLAGAALYVWLHPPARVVLGTDSLSSFPARMGNWAS